MIIDFMPAILTGRVGLLWGDGQNSGQGKGLIDVAVEGPGQMLSLQAPFLAVGLENCVVI
jgi:hypothetical protein